MRYNAWQRGQPPRDEKHGAHSHPYTEQAAARGQGKGLSNNYTQR